MVDNFDAKNQNYDQLYYKNDDYNKVINYIADLKNEGEYPKNAQLIEVMSNGKMRKFDSSMLANGGGVRSFRKGGRIVGEDARLEYVDDAFASEELKDELREKLNIKGNSLGDNVVISFAYTDYGGDFLDKVAIRYFEENYPENT